MRLFRRPSLLLALLLVASPAFAERTGEIRGVIVDTSGSPVSDVLVTASGPALQGTRRALSDGSGTFRLPLLPVGTYALAFSRGGAEAARISETGVGLRSTVNVRVTLGPSGAERASVAVPLLDAAQRDTSLQFTAADLALVPAQGRTIAEITDLTPSVNGVRTSTVTGTDTGLPSIRGEGENGNNWIVDGLSSRGVAWNDPGPRVNYDAWATAQIVSDGFSADLGQAMGGFVNVVTRSGGNQLHGEGGALIRDDQLRAKQEEQLSAASLPQKSIDQYYANLGGPVLADRLWFFLSDNFLANTEKTTDQAVGWLQIPAGTHKSSSNDFFGKLSATPAEGHTLSFGATVDRSVDESGGTGVPALYTSSRFDDRIYRLSYDGVLSPNVTLTGGVGHSRRDSSYGPQTGDYGPPSYYWRDIAQGTNNVLDHGASFETRTEVALGGGWTIAGGRWGRHEFRAGLSYSRVSSDISARFTGHDLDPWRGNGFDDGTSVAWTSPGMPEQLVEYTPGAASNSTTGIGFYLQDTISLGRITATFGIRSDTQHVYNDLGKELWSWGVRDFLQPRVAVAIDVTGDGRTLLQASYGVFAAPVTTDSLAFFNNTWLSSGRVYLWKGPANPLASQLSDPANWDFVLEQSPNGMAEAIDPALKPNSTERVVLGLARQLSPGLAVTLRGVYSHTVHLIEDVALYLPDSPQLFNLLLTNFDAKRRDYRALEFGLNGRVGTTLFLNASYTWSRARGSTTGNATEGPGLYDLPPFGEHPDVPASDPNKAMIDAFFGGLGGPGVGDEGWYGDLPYSVDHVVKVFATWVAPWGITVSPGVEWLSGYHWEKRGWQEAYSSYLTFPEGRGGRTTPSHAYVDLGVKKRFLIGRGTSLDVGVNVFNLFNSQRPVSYVKEDTELFGQVWGRQQPRWVQLTAALVF
jgi:hypothetical protein